MIVRFVAAACLVAASTHDLSGQQPPTADQMRAMLEKTQPTTQHHELASLVGQWTQEITYRMGASQTITTKGTAVNRMILGGRFLVSESSSTAPPGTPPGTAMETMRIYGFDRRINQFTISELDSMGTYWVSAAGARKDSVIVMSGESLDDHGGTPDMRKFAMVLRLVDPDTYVTEVIFKFPGRPDLKLVEALHRRVR